MTNTTEKLKRTALYENHQQREGKLVPFGGYELPVWFTSIKEEHLSVRQAAGVFDISHMGVIRLSGEGAGSFLQKVSCNDIQKTNGGKMIYSMILNREGMILDDIMVGSVGDEFVLVVNASNREKLLRWFESVGTEGVRLSNLETTHSFLALQGPHALDILASALGISSENMPKFAVQDLEILGEGATMMRTGYTGEDGVELVLPNTIVERVWSILIDAGAVPCGLGARDTLRLEAGLPLYGQELSESIHPLMTRYSWVLKFETDFIGKDALLSVKDKPKEWTTVGLEILDKGIPRSHYPIKEGGEVTSGTFSPSLEKAIAMAMVKPEFAQMGQILTIDVRGRACQARVIPLPFYRSQSA